MSKELLLAPIDSFQVNFSLTTSEISFWKCTILRIDYNPLQLNWFIFILTVKLKRSNGCSCLLSSAISTNAWSLYFIDQSSSILATERWMQKSVRLMRHRFSSNLQVRWRREKEATLNKDKEIQNKLYETSLQTNEK